jgi:hypothetical protein
MNYATIRVNMSGVSDGTEFYKKFCSPKPISADILQSRRPEIQKTIIPDYLAPFLESNDSVVTGYFINKPGFQEVAVLFISTFTPTQPKLFQRTIEMFIEYCRENGKKKIIIDLQKNPGGFIFQGYDTFRQFFPRVKPEGFSRFRESDQFMAMARAHSDAAGKIDPDTTRSSDAMSFWLSPWNWRFDHDAADKPFQSFAAKFSPKLYKGDPYTSLLQYNLDDPTLVSSIGMEITGYGRRRDFSQPFRASDIIMLTDGYCASTCSLFSTMMKWQGDVKTIAFGGRPVSAPMQGVGGVKGAQVSSFERVYNLTRNIIRLDGSLTSIDKAQRSAFERLTDLPLKRGTGSSLNIRDQILRSNVEDGIAAQFVFEPADCKLSLTLKMLQNVEEMWMAAAMAAWYGGKCISGKGFPESNAKNFKGVTGSEVRPEREENPGGLLSRSASPRKRGQATRVVNLEDAGLGPGSPEMLVDWREYDYRVWTV